MPELEAFMAVEDGWDSFRRHSSTRPQVRVRDPFTWPYPPESPWNMPRGQDAVLAPLGFVYDPDGPFANGRIAGERVNEKRRAAAELAW